MSCDGQFQGVGREEASTNLGVWAQGLARAGRARRVMERMVAFIVAEELVPRRGQLSGDGEGQVEIEGEVAGVVKQVGVEISSGSLHHPGTDRPCLHNLTYPVSNLCSSSSCTAIRLCEGYLSKYILPISSFVFLHQWGFHKSNLRAMMLSNLNAVHTNQ